jgi:hypothetical protein
MVTVPDFPINPGLDISPVARNTFSNASAERLRSASPAVNKLN